MLDGLKHRRRNKMQTVAFVLVGLAVLASGSLWYRSRQQNRLDASPPTAPVNPLTTTVTDKTQEPASPPTLWARSERGQPIDLPYAPSGVQAIVRVRLADAVAHPEGDKIIKSLGPDIQPLLSSWLDRVGVEAHSLETLTLYFAPTPTPQPQVVAVGTLIPETDHSSLPSFEPASDQMRISQLGNDAVWFPQGQQQTFVYGSKSLLASMDAGDEPTLRRELDHLRAATQNTDHITVLVNPNFLRDEVVELLPGIRSRLVNQLYEFWTEEAQAVSIGVQLSSVSVIEVRIIASEDRPTRALAAHVRRYTDRMPLRLRDFLERIELDPFWRPLAGQYPAMTQFLADQCRVATEGRQVVVNAALPMEALHGLVLATELGLSSPVGDPMVIAHERAAWTINDVLSANFDVRFDQKSLDSAVKALTEQVRDELPELSFEFNIQVVGSELEVFGITRNQQIRNFSVRGSLSTILTELVRQADPGEQNRNAGNMVWVPSPTVPGEILITTLDSVRREQWTLPSNFGD